MKKRLNIGCRIDWRKKSEGWICNDILPFKFLIEATKYKYGDVIDFVRELYHISFKTAVKLLIKIK